MARTVMLNRPRVRKNRPENDGARDTFSGARYRDAASRRAALERLDWIANLMDSAVVIPGTNVTVGLDAVIGLFPGIGDTITTG
ncbi:MAG: DUF4112 domain-containing protein, partial [Pseudolabrys sp.]|nr:DUF4112 domain-containing protein [Pseudolabrys sp.]